MSACQSCGRSNAEGMRFCRFCGQAVVTGPIEAAATQHLAAETGPAYVSPTPGATGQPTQVMAAPPNAPEPAAAPPMRKKRGRWLAILLVLFLAVGTGTVVALIWAFKRVEESVKNALPLPEVTNPTPETAQASLGDLYYPGAVPQPGIRQGGNALITLSTPDSVTKVHAFYSAKLKGVRQIFRDDEGFALAFERGVVSAKREGNETQILVALKADNLTEIPVP